MLRIKIKKRFAQLKYIGLGQCNVKVKLKISIRTYGLKICIVQFCPEKRTRQGIMYTANFQIIGSLTSVRGKQDSLREMEDSRMEAGKVEDETAVSSWARKSFQSFSKGTPRIWLKIVTSGQRCANLIIGKIAATCSNMDGPHRDLDTKTSTCHKILLSLISDRVSYKNGWPSQNNGYMVGMVKGNSVIRKGGSFQVVGI